MVNKNNKPHQLFQRLSILIDQGGFSFYLHHSNPKESKSAGKHQVEDIFGSKSLKLFKHQLKDILKTYNYKEVKVAFANSYYAFVPEDYYHEEAKADYLKYNVELFEGDHITSDYIEAPQVQQVYIPLMNYHNSILELIDEFEYQHFTNVLVQHAQPKDFDNENYINVYVRQSSIDILAYEGMKFKLCNSFAYDTDYDLAYYVLFALEELNFNQLEVQMNLFHDSDQTSWLEVLKRYVKHVHCNRTDLAALIY